MTRTSPRKRPRSAITFSTHRTTENCPKKCYVAPVDTAPAAAPMLLRLRSGKIAALVIGGGLGGGTVLLGVGSTAASALQGAAILGALVGYALAVVPLLLLAAIVAVCKS